MALKHLTEGTAASQKHTISLAASSGVTDSSAALALGEYQEKRAVQFLDPLHDGGVDLEQEVGDKVIKQRIPKELTPEQQAAKEEKAKRAKDISNIKKSCTAVKNHVTKVQALIVKYEKNLPQTGGNLATTNVLKEFVPKLAAYEASFNECLTDEGMVGKLSDKATSHV